MEKFNFNIVLVAPEIPGNTGSIGRTALALNAKLILIKPLAFDISEKAVRRAGLDYWKHVCIEQYDDWESFEATHSQEQFIFFENNLPNLAPKNYTEANYHQGCSLIFGSETKGIPLNILNRFPTQIYQLPILSPHIRSVNLACAATSVAFHCLQQITRL
jgi:tRNA (cytidine/uridine-2'-O-)-methyltransferase